MGSKIENIELSKTEKQRNTNLITELITSAWGDIEGFPIILSLEIREWHNREGLKTCKKDKPFIKRLVKIKCKETGCEFGTHSQVYLEIHNETRHEKSNLITIAESQKAGILGILDTEEHFPNHSNWGTFLSKFIWKLYL